MIEWMDWIIGTPAFWVGVGMGGAYLIMGRS